MKVCSTIKALLKWRKILAAIVLVVLITVVPALWEWIHAWIELRRPQKESTRIESFKPFAGVRIASNEVASFLLSRVAFLLPNAQLHTIIGPAGSQQLSFSGTGNGCAVTIDRRGYFLTAAHCVSSNTNDLRLFFFSPDTNSNWTQLHIIAWPRVVWRGDKRKGEPDLAILHLNGGQERSFDLAGEVHKDQPVMAVGWASTTSNFRGFDLLGGRVLELQQTTHAAEASILATDLPLQPGDSGGPLVDSEGRLIGINIGREFSFTGWVPPKLTSHATTVRPNVRWLSNIIEADVAAHAAQWQRTNAAR